ncbi:MAG: S8 family serine peptidase, partial [Pyrinomonadaceae bacterium]
MDPANHDHQHTPNRFGVIPTSIRLNADPTYTGKGVTVAFLDSGFYPHADLLEPTNRVIAYHDLAGERCRLSSS